MSHYGQIQFDFQKGLYQENSEQYYLIENNKIQKGKGKRPESGEFLFFPEKTSEIENETITGQDVQHYHDLFAVLLHYYDNPLAALAVSKTMLLPHQVEAAVAG